MKGPAGSPYEEGLFLLDVCLPSEYPLKPPKITFRTPVFHCNVSANGFICLDMLRNQWSPAMSVANCMQAILEMLKRPNSNDALRPAIAELYFAYRQSGGTDMRYIEQAREATCADASRSLEDWETSWGIGA